MTWRTGLRLAAVVLLLVLPNLCKATCDYVGANADGKVLGPFSLSSGTDDLSVRFNGQAGHSYVLEAITLHGPSGAGAASFVYNVNETFCPSANIASGVTITDISSVAPSAGAATEGYLRLSLVVTTSLPFIEVRVSNGSSSASQVLVTVTETTLFSPRWSTFSGFITFYGFANTTDTAISTTLTLTDTGGNVVATSTQSIPAGQIVYLTSTQLGVANNDAGMATLIHNGPAGGILADAIMGNFVVSPPTTIVGKFEERHSVH